MASYRTLDAWKRAMELATACYRLSEHFPASERFGMTSQLRRAAVSVPCNIAEGCGRNSRRELLHFISIARGSLKELETLLELSTLLGFGESSDINAAEKLSDRVSRLLWKLRARFQAP